MSEPTASKIDFKRAETKDLALVADWIKRYYTYDHIAFDEAKVKQGLWKLLETDTYGLAYFVELAGQPIGYFILTYAFDIEFGGVHAVITDLFFGEEARRTGAGTASLKFIEKLCLESGITDLLLQVEVDNVEAQAFYRKSGITTLTRHILAKNFQGSST